MSCSIEQCACQWLNVLPLSPTSPNSKASENWVKMLFPILPIFCLVMASDGEKGIFGIKFWLAIFEFWVKTERVRSYHWLYSAQWWQVTTLLLAKHPWNRLQRILYVTHNLHHHFLLSTGVPQTLRHYQHFFCNNLLPLLIYRIYPFNFQLLARPPLQASPFLLRAVKTRRHNDPQLRKRTWSKIVSFQLSRLTMALLVRFHQVCVLVSCSLLLYIFCVGFVG